MKLPTFWPFCESRSPAGIIHTSLLLWTIIMGFCQVALAMLQSSSTWTRYWTGIKRESRQEKNHLKKKKWSCGCSMKAIRWHKNQFDRQNTQRLSFTIPSKDQAIKGRQHFPTGAENWYMDRYLIEGFAKATDPFKNPSKDIKRNPTGAIFL